jgi:hypothetical protein
MSAQNVPSNTSRIRLERQSRPPPGGSHNLLAQTKFVNSNSGRIPACFQIPRDLPELLSLRQAKRLHLDMVVGMGILLVLATMSFAAPRAGEIEFKTKQLFVVIAPGRELLNRSALDRLPAHEMRGVLLHS